MDMLLAMPANTSADWQLLVDIGLDVNNLDKDLVNNLLIVNAALLNNAKQGDVNSIKELRSIIQDNAYLKLQREKIWLEKQKIQKPLQQKTLN